MSLVTIIRPQAGILLGSTPCPLAFCRRAGLVVLSEEVGGGRNGVAAQGTRTKAPPAWLHAQLFLPPTGLQFVLAKVPMLRAGLGFFSLA